MQTLSKDQVALRLQAPNGAAALMEQAEAALDGALALFLEDQDPAACGFLCRCAKSNRLRQQIQQEIHRVVQGIADANGCSASVAFQHGPAPLVNSHEVIQQLKAAWSSLFGPDSIDPLESVMSSEDFSDILSQVGEGAFVRLGITKEGAPLHHIHTEEFDFNDEAIVYGIALLVKFIMDRHGGQ